MKLAELASTKIVLLVMGERGALKDEEELSLILKKRLTKKERTALNAHAQNIPLEAIASALGCDNERALVVLDGAVKKIKNVKVHQEFYC